MLFGIEIEDALGGSPMWGCGVVVSFFGSLSGECFWDVDGSEVLVLPDVGKFVDENAFFDWSPTVDCVETYIS